MAHHTETAAVKDVHEQQKIDYAVIIVWKKDADRWPAALYAAINTKRYTLLMPPFMRTKNQVVIAEKIQCHTEIPPQRHLLTIDELSALPDGTKIWLEYYRHDGYRLDANTYRLKKLADGGWIFEGYDFYPNSDDGTATQLDCEGGLRKIFSKGENS